jgi:hypothetical protein
MATLVIVMPMGYAANSVHAQQFGQTTKAPTTTNGPILTTVKNPLTNTPAQNILKVDVILFGINNKTGNVVTFVTARNETQAVAANATQLNIKSENSTGVAEVFFSFPNLKVQVGDKIQACNILVKDLTQVCGTGLKSPLNKTESIDLLVGPPSSSALNKSPG